MKVTLSGSTFVNVVVVFAVVVEEDKEMEGNVVPKKFVGIGVVVDGFLPAYGFPLHGSCGGGSIHCPVEVSRYKVSQ
jgi:hypothetical protein